MPQCARIGWPGKIGHDSLARSHTVTTKSHGSRSNPSMLRGAWPDHGMSYSRSVSIAWGFTRSAGREPALSAWNRPLPFQLSRASAIWLRAEFPVHTKRTRNIV
jgi:hypothetical protein